MSTAAITVRLNGEERQLAADSSAAAAVDAWRQEADAPYVVSVNGAHVPRERLAATALRAGDEIEILTLRQGG